MKIVCCIFHPAHVHMFYNAIKIWKEHGNDVKIFAQKREVIYELLNNMNLDYVGLSEYKTGFQDKLKRLWCDGNKLLAFAKRYKPDIFVATGAPVVALPAKLSNTPYVAFDDTEYSRLIFYTYLPFTTTICTPACFKPEFGANHIRYKGYHELAYLHSKYFSPDSSALRELRIKENEKFVVLRFVTHSAVHDVGGCGLDINTKRNIVKSFSQYAKVFISSEEDLPLGLKKFSININPSRLQSVIYSASLVYTEGATIASESSIMGVPTIYINRRSLSYIEDQKRFGGIFTFKDTTEDKLASIKKGVEILSNTDVTPKNRRIKREKILKDNIDVTAFMVYLIENYPRSFKAIKADPNFQVQFK